MFSLVSRKFLAMRNIALYSVFVFSFIPMQENCSMKKILSQKNLALEVATIYVLTEAITDKRKNEIQYYFTLRVKTKSMPTFCQLSIALRQFTKCNIFLYVM